MVDSINVRRISRRRAKSAANAGCVVGPIARWAELLRPHQQNKVYFLMQLFGMKMSQFWNEIVPIFFFVKKVRFIPFFHFIP